MRTSVKSALAGVATLAMAVGLLTVGATSASAAVNTGIYNDPNAYGVLSFYDDLGNRVTSGSTTTAPFVKYAVASQPADVVVSPNTATLILYPVDPTQVPGNWSGIQLGSSTQYPNASAPAPINTNPNPVNTGGTADYTLADAASAYPSPPSAQGTAAQDVYQIRMKTRSSTNWQIADIKITGTTWTQIFPAPPVGTTTKLAASKTSPQTAPAAYDLTATVAPATTGRPAPSGTVAFFDGTTSLGTAPVSATGTATLPLSNVPAGSYSYTAVYYGDLDNDRSTSNTVPFTVEAPGTATSTNLAVDNAAPAAGAPVTFTAAVTPTTVSGTVTFTDSVAGVLGTDTTNDGAGNYSLTTSTLSPGAHSITATFSGTGYNSSTSQPVTVNVAAPACPTGSQCTDDQPFQVTVDAGSISISTPYTVASPFDLGSMVLAADGTTLSASKAFGDSANPAQGVTITDRRAGDLPWTASLVATDFQDAATNKINAQNMGFTGVTPKYQSGNALNATTKPVVTYDNAADSTVHAGSDTGTAGLRGTAKKFADAAHGIGTVNVVGTMTLNAPTSTPAGLYKSTVTFTIA